MYIELNVINDYFIIRSISRISFETRGNKSEKKTNT